MKGAPPEAVAWSTRHTAMFAATVSVLALLPWTVRHWPSQERSC